MKCCISLQLDGWSAKPQALSTARQYRRIFPDADIFLFAPEGHPAAKPVLDALGGAEVRRIPSIATTVLQSGDQFRQTTDFYDTFEGYDYVLVGSLATWPFYDALEWWMEQGCDYIAAPWLSLHGSNSTWIRGLDLPRGGRGCASLRRVETCRDFAQRLHKCGYDLQKQPLWDDLVLSGALPEYARGRLPKLKCYPRAEQARFAWDRPALPDEDSTRSCSMETLMAITRGHLPMLAFEPSPGVWRRLCSESPEPRTVFLLSNAVNPAYDYSKLLAMEPDPNRRLFVLFNKCVPLLHNQSAVDLVKSLPSVLTLHNNTNAEPYGPAFFGETPLLLRNIGFKGRHDTRTLMWRPPGGTEPGMVTYDGEVVDVRMTKALQRLVTNGVNGATATAGYIGYHLMRTMYPQAKLVLVNFFGNAKGFTVYFKHNPSWEQEIYRRDPMVEMVDLSA